MPADSRPAILVDEQNVTALVRDLARAVSTHYGRRHGNDAVFEALNALAVVTAGIIAGTVPNGTRTRAFFDLALDDNLAETQRAFAPVRQ